MKAAIITCDKKHATSVFGIGMIEKLKSRYDLYPDVICKGNIDTCLDFLKDTEYLFATWGMEHFTAEEIRQYFPKLKCLYYAAGSVQSFAKEFLDCGVRVFSAWQANAVPVAEFTHAQIILALKGFFFAQRNAVEHRQKAFAHTICCGGAYDCKVGIIGVGCIGSMVAEKLKQNDITVLCYDAFLSEERAEELQIRKVSLEKLFAECDVISNHLADKDELVGVLNGDLFAKMKPYATFINTGRGRQVDEPGLIAAMKLVPTRTALLDVTNHEPVSSENELTKCENIILTPHIAGSLGRELTRMAQYMLDDAERIDKSEPPFYEVTNKMLETMA